VIGGATTASGVRTTGVGNRLFKSHKNNGILVQNIVHQRVLKLES
jgi:hypothetical protein